MVGLWQLNSKIFLLSVFCFFLHFLSMPHDQPKKKAELYGHDMEMLGEDLAKSNEMLGSESKNDQLGAEAIEAMQSLIKNKQSDSD